MKFSEFKAKLAELSTETKQARDVYEQKVETLNAFMQASVGVADGETVQIGSVIDMISKISDMKAEENQSAIIRV